MPKGDGRGFFWHFWVVRGDTSLQSQAIPCLSPLPESCLHACVCARCRHRGPGHRLAARTPGPPGHGDRPRGARCRRERRPQLDPLGWRGGMAFLAACNAQPSRDTTAKLLALAASSRTAFEAMQADIAPDCDLPATGKLVLYASAAALAGARAQLELQRTMGSQQRIVAPDECIAIEPALASYRSQMAGAVYTPSECAADCLKVCAELMRSLEARGVRFLPGTDVHGFARNGHRIAAVHTSQGDIEADAFVMALGSASHKLGRALGAYLPVYPLKGYSITVAVDPSPGAAPTVNVTDSARKVVFARIGSRLRVAGMAELVGHDAGIPATRIATLAAATRALFPHAGRLEELHPWTGMRP